MIIFALAFLCGVIFLDWHVVLPSLYYAYGLGSVALILIYLHRAFVVVAGFAIGFAWAIICAHQLLHWQLPHAMENNVLHIRGIVETIPIKSSDNIQFQFYVSTITADQKILHPKAKIKLYWHQPDLQVMAHDHLQLRVKLKRIHGLASPGAINSEQFAFVNGLRATGVVLKSSDNKLLASVGRRGILNRWRQQLLQKIEPLLPLSHTKPWLIALMLGERQGMPQSDWEILRRTGTNHLMAIAGLHIGMMAAIANLVMGFIWRRCAFLQFTSMQVMCAWSMLITAITYSALAGFSLPTQRAGLMISFFLVARLLGLKVSTWHIFSLVIMIVLLLDPFNIYSNSFWLSFGTIALIIIGMQGRLSPRNFWWRWGRVQWVIGCGLIPVSLTMFSEASLISFFVNCLAIPFLGIAILPICLIGLGFAFISSTLSHWIFWLADFNLSILWQFLTWCAALQFGQWQQYLMQPFIFSSLMIAVIILLLPRGIYGRAIGLFWCLPLYFQSHLLLPSQTVSFTLLDVGQGLAAVIQTAHHALIYDAGNQFVQGSDMGTAVVIPFLQTSGIKKIDFLILSHGDADHIGGAASILAWQNKLPIYTSDRSKIMRRFVSAKVYTCLAGMHWQWDGVQFEFIYPDVSQLGLNNNSSCVLRIQIGKRVILLTGDIERRAEKYLLAQNPRALKADIIIAPHHGSKTSADSNFLAQVKPSQVWYPIGYLNRYHFPHQTVIGAYKKIGAEQFDTASSGSLQVLIGNKQIGFPVRHYRFTYRKYWQD